MSRPAQLLLIALVYALGIAIAFAEGVALDVTELVVGVGTLLPVAASVHYANEYADYWSDRLTSRTPFSGGSGALARTGLPRRLALSAGLLEPIAVPLAAVIAVFGWAYSVGPAFARHGLGELDNAALGGLVLPLYGYAVASGQVRLDALLACVPFALLVFANLLATQWPDRRADAAVGKNTVPTRWSPRRLRGLYLACVALAFGSLPVLEGTVLPLPVAWASFLSLPLVLWGMARFTRRRSPFPTVAAMVCLAVVQTGSWTFVALR